MTVGRGLAFKLTFAILASTLLIFSAMLLSTYLDSRRMLLRRVEQNARNLAMATVYRLNTVLASVEKVPQDLAIFLESTALEGGELIKVLGKSVEGSAEVFGAAIAFEPYAYSANSLCFAPYFCKRDGRLSFSYLDCETYRYFYWDWYQLPKLLRRPVWSEPYYDEGGGNIVMSTYSVPFYEGEGDERSFLGVVTADVSLSWLQSYVSGIRIAQSGYAFLISKNGTFVTHPDQGLVMNQTIFTLAEARRDPRLRAIGRDMIAGKTGFVPFTSILTGKRCWMVYAPLPSNGWSLGVLFPQEELMADVTRLNRRVLLLAIGGFILLFVVIVVLSRTITRPLRSLAGATDRIASGDLDGPLPSIRSRDEVGTLAASIASMQEALKQYIQELTETTAAKERIESELKIARDIQMGIVPKLFPPFPSREELDIYADLVPAREVGGDLYDFFFLDGQTLCLTVGDVAGKGVPAALMMAVTQTLVKGKAAPGMSPEAIVRGVNHDLSQDNPSVTFVTLFLALLDVRTGRLRYCSAGHNPPYLLRSQGEVKPLPLTGDTVLGVMEELVYHAREVTLSPGDALFLYTDGITEAMNQEGELFGDQRLAQALKGLCTQDARPLAQGVFEAVEGFVQGAEQADDMTVVALRFKGEGPKGVPRQA